MGRRAFTLVELIITIAVIAVLAVTAFLVVTKWISKSRDSSRLQDIAVIQQGLETEIVNTKTYPMPDNYTGIYDTGNALAWYQGEFTDNVKGNITTLNKTPKDPQGRNYGYSLSNDKKQYQLRAFLENTSYNFNYTDRVSAATQISKINGNYNGFLVTRQSYSTGNVYSLWNIPTLFLWSGNVISSGSNYVSENNKVSDNITSIKFADVSGLYDTNTSNNMSTLDNIISTFSGTNGINNSQLATLALNKSAGAPQTLPSNLPNDGACGASNGQGFTGVPTTGLCISGIPSNVITNSNTYTWSCAGVNGGISPICTANILSLAAYNSRGNYAIYQTTPASILSTYGANPCSGGWNTTTCQNWVNAVSCKVGTDCYKEVRQTRSGNDGCGYDTPSAALNRVRTYAGNSNMTCYHCWYGSCQCSQVPCSTIYN